MCLPPPAVFLGVIERIPQDPQTAMAWVSPDGQIMSVDAVFTDFLGWLPTDLAGGEFMRRLLAAPSRVLEE